MTYLIIHAALAEDLHIVSLVPSFDDLLCSFGIFDVQPCHTEPFRRLMSSAIHAVKVTHLL